MSFLTIVSVMFSVYFVGFIVGIYCSNRKEKIGHLVIAEDEFGNRSVYVSAKKSLEEVSKKRSVNLMVKVVKLTDSRKNNNH